MLVKARFSRSLWNQRAAAGSRISWSKTRYKPQTSQFPIPQVPPKIYSCLSSRSSRLLLGKLSLESHGDPKKKLLLHSLSAVGYWFINLIMQIAVTRFLGALIGSGYDGWDLSWDWQGWVTNISSLDLPSLLITTVIDAVLNSHIVGSSTRGCKAWSCHGKSLLHTHPRRT